MIHSIFIVSKGKEEKERSIRLREEEIKYNTKERKKKDEGKERKEGRSEPERASIRIWNRTNGCIFNKDNRYAKHASVWNIQE